MVRAKKNGNQPAVPSSKRPRKNVVPFQVETPTKSRAKAKKRATQPNRRSPAKKRPKQVKPKKTNKKQAATPHTKGPKVCNAQTHSFTYPTANMFTTGLQHNTEYTAPSETAEWSNFGQSSYLY